MRSTISCLLYDLHDLVLMSL